MVELLPPLWRLRMRQVRRVSVTITSLRDMGLFDDLDYMQCATFEAGMQSSLRNLCRLQGRFDYLKTGTSTPQMTNPFSDEYFLMNGQYIAVEHIVLSYPFWCL